jgi:hypothetical protein
LILKTVAILAALVLGVAATNAGPTDPSPCLPPSAGGSTMLSVYQWTDTTTDAGNIAWRQSLGLTSIAVTQITLVSDTTTCRRGVIAYNSILAADQLPASVAVNLIRYGSTRYIISDPVHVVGEWIHEAVVDTAFHRIAVAGR